MMLGERIRQRLEQLGVSQAELARRVGIGQRSMNYLCNKAQSSSAHTHTIARELQVSIEWLTGKTDHMQIGHETGHLTDQQREWLSLLDVLPEKERDVAFLIVRHLAEAISAQKEKGR